MSFADFSQKGNGSQSPSYARADRSWGIDGGSGLGPAGAGGSESEESRMLRQLQDGMQVFARRVAQLDDAVKLIGTPRDNHALRARVRNGVDEAQVQMHELAAQVKRVSAVDLSGAAKQRYSAQRQKLIEDFVRSGNDFKRVSQLAAEREKAPIPEAVLRQARAAGAGADEQERQALLEAERREQAAQLESQRAYIDGVNLEREEEVRQLEANVTQVNEMFHDLAQIIREQDVLIDNIDSNVSRALDDVEEGEKNIDKAVSYQKKGRSKMCCILVTAIILLLVVIVCIVVPVVVKKYHKKS